MKNEEATALLERLENHDFALTPAQREIFRDAKGYYLRIKPRE